MATTYAGYILSLLIFPGFVFTAVFGLVTAWVDRKVTARVQWRVGPPWYQPFVDVVKLLGKETLVPENSRRTGFLMMPLVALTAVTLASTILWYVGVFGVGGFGGDLIVILYLFTVPSMAMIQGASASGNPVAAVGASREMKLILSYELPFLIAAGAAIVKVGSVKLVYFNQFATPELTGVGEVCWVLSGIIGFVVALLCVQAKLGFVPFDMSEAETEIMGGTLVEYSGPPLAVFKLTKAMLFFTLPVFMITVFWGGLKLTGIDLLWTILKWLLIVVLIVVIKNTNPRIRIDQAMRFFWKILTPLAIVGLVLALAAK